MSEDGYDELEQFGAGHAGIKRKPVATIESLTRDRDAALAQLSVCVEVLKAFADEAAMYDDAADDTPLLARNADGELADTDLTVGDLRQGARVLATIPSRAKAMAEVVEAAKALVVRHDADAAKCNFERCGCAECKPFRALS